MSLLPYLERVVQRENLTAEDAHAAMQTILSGQASQAQMAGFLIALRMKGETVDELVGFARAMREMAAPVDVGLNGQTLLDTCGTGGGDGTFNISTVAAFVAAGAGVHVAKHGNRSYTSPCGSADLLEALGIDIAFSPEQAASAIREVGIGFLFAPHVHSAMKHAAPVRAELKMRTALNLLGPLTNPAGADTQLAGALLGTSRRTDCRRPGGSRAAARLRGARIGRPGRDHHHRSHARVRDSRWPRGAPLS